MLYRPTVILALPTLATLIGIAAIAPASAQTDAAPTYQLAQATVVVAPNAPPPPQTETIPPPPATTSVTTYWQPGHWDWNGASWVWTAGSYVQRVQQPTATATWVPGQWVQQSSGGYVWIAGHWQT